jgi:hypothetical protein
MRPHRTGLVAGPDRSRACRVARFGRPRSRRARAATRRAGRGEEWFTASSAARDEAICGGAAYADFTPHQRRLTSTSKGRTCADGGSAGRDVAHARKPSGLASTSRVSDCLRPRNPDPPPTRQARTRAGRQQRRHGAPPRNVNVPQQTVSHTRVFNKNFPGRSSGNPLRSSLPSACVHPGRYTHSP